MAKKKRTSPKSTKDTTEWNYDPVKREIGGVEAEKVIWSTKSLEAAVQALNEGLPLKANPFCGKDIQLLRPDLLYKRTEEEVQDYIKCMKDPLYFASKCKIMTPEGLQDCKLRDYQEEYIRHLQNNRFSILLAARQIGKSVITAIYCLHVIIFNNDKNGLILSKSGPAAADLLEKIKTMYRYLPYHLKAGTMKWNQGSISFDNNSTISMESFSPTAGLGKTINFLILDEFAWTPQNDAKLFYMNIIPTVTTISDSNVCIMSTQNGHNLFYEIWDAAIRKKNIYAPFKVDWYQVPQYNMKTKQWEKRDEKWKEEMVGILGSEEAFQYQYGTQFSASDKCLVSRECIGKMRDTTVLFETREDFSEKYTLRYPECLSWDPNFNLEELNTGYFFCLIDLAEGGGGDFTVFNIFQVKEENKYVQVGTWTSNKIDLEHVALEFWLLGCQLFNNERCLTSIEWNTYGALFYRILMDLNDIDYDEENSWRFNINGIDPDGFDQTRIVNYKKGSMEDNILGVVKSSSKFIPGIRFSSGNKSAACSLLKMSLERGDIELKSLATVSELENFEDKNGSGSYKASYGHDDQICTCLQIPMMQQTPIWKDFIEEFNLNNLNDNRQNKWNDDSNSLYGSSFDFTLPDNSNNWLSNRIR